MNVLFVNHEKGGGGASYSLYELAKELVNKGHSIYVLTPYNEGTFFEKIKTLNVIVIYEPFYNWTCGNNSIKEKIRWFLVYKRTNKRIARKIAGYANNKKIDVIHSNSSVTNIGALISKYSGIPHVWHLREFGSLDIGTSFYESTRKIYNFMNRYSNKFICVSRAISDYYGSLDDAKKIVIYNGVSVDYLDETHKISDGVINIIISGHIFYYKGQHEAVEACSMLLEQGIGNFVLNIVGKGELYFDIPESLQSRVKLWGEVNDIKNLRKSMDIELVCSRCEAFGRVVAEAMLGGLTVIGTNNGGIPELINHGHNGFLYNQGDIPELCNLLKYLILNPRIREQVGVCSREYAKENFLISRCADEVENVYSNII